MRAIVPGWYGMASVKWLTRIIVTDRPYNGYFQSLDYSIFERRQGLVTVTPITEMNWLKPDRRQPNPRCSGSRPNTPTRVHGVAWCGESNIARVEISSDNGQTWAAARVAGNEIANTWRMWEFAWRTPSAQVPCALLAATDARGIAQTMQRDGDRRNYVINHVLPVEIDVRSI